MTISPGNRILASLLLSALAIGSQADTQAPVAPAPARVMFLGLFHFDNPGLDAVKFTPIDVMQPGEQAYLVALSERLAGKYELARNEVYQLGFRVAKLSGHARVYGFDAAAPAAEDKLWDYLSKVPASERKMIDLIAAESARLESEHRTMSLRDVLAKSNSPEEDLRNKGFYMLLNDVAADNRLFYGADSSARWWHRNLRMYALVQMHAQPGDRVLVIAGSGHTAILRDYLRADSERLEEDILSYF